MSLKVKVGSRLGEPLTRAHTHSAADIVSALLAAARGGLAKELDLTGLLDGYIIYYDAASDKFKVKAESGGGGGGNHNLLSATHLDTLPATLQAGDLVYGNATPKWARLAKDVDGKLLKLVSGLPGWEYADWSELTGKPSTFPPSAHKTSHQDGGADEISIAGLSGLLADAQTPLAHKTSHQVGGSDELDLGGLDYSTFAQLTNQASAPGMPGSGKIRLYSKTDKRLYHKNDAGLETALSWVSPFWWPFPLMVCPVANQTGTAARFFIAPYFFPVKMTITKISVTIQVAGGAGTYMRFGLYADNTRTPVGGAVLEDSGDYDATITGPRGYTLPSPRLIEGLIWGWLETADTVIQFTRQAGTAFIDDETGERMRGGRYDRVGGYGAPTDPCPSITADNTARSWMAFRATIGG